VDDMIDGFIRVMQTDDAFIGPINLGNPNEFTILELAERIMDMTGSKSRLEFQPLPSDDPIKRQPDISLAKKTIDWIPQINLEQGLNKTIPYFEKLLKHA
jgi:UDP-glucuronate decarboxylase